VSHTIAALLLLLLTTEQQATTTTTPKRWQETGGPIRTASHERQLSGHLYGM
jgi:hypothetical protein